MIPTNSKNTHSPAGNTESSVDCEPIRTSQIGCVEVQHAGCAAQSEIQIADTSSDKQVNRRCQAELNGVFGGRQNSDRTMSSSQRGRFNPCGALPTACWTSDYKHSSDRSLEFKAESSRLLKAGQCISSGPEPNPNPRDLELREQRTRLICILSCLGVLYETTDHVGSPRCSRLLRRHVQGRQTGNPTPSSLIPSHILWKLAFREGLLSALPWTHPRYARNLLKHSLSSNAGHSQGSDNLQAQDKDAFSQTSLDDGQPHACTSFGVVVIYLVGWKEHFALSLSAYYVSTPQNAAPRVSGREAVPGRNTSLMSVRPAVHEKS
ncbi:hypothetical protein M011DRAFT_213132 [Sporormia fimetaria CBS 119925]|uniref:Uncharacterized protein n=1 Tax=Sporormia fimetaria CBS 119925 TaxID=1340428 RepID=A0A6A6V1V0_9PLEO|nr:hypothetical protein M011DRAFT_213132 [Sporormia fimetaria CBS 119925]